MEQTVCLLCGVQDERPLLRRAQPRHVVCRRCGLVYQNPRPTLAEISAYYLQGYWEDRGAVASGDEQPISDASIERGRAIVGWTQSFVSQGDLAVEIGCGHGEILAYVRDELGCQALGVEPSRSQAAAAAQRFGLNMQQTDLDGVALPGPPAKLLVLSHVLEHFHDPRAALARCRELLVEEGWVFIEVPNILNPHPRKRLSTWLAVEHMYYYSATTLGRLLTEAGFRVTQSDSKSYVRVLAQKTAAPAPDSTGKNAPDNEYRRVLRALLRHDLVYWPRYAIRRAAGALGWPS